MTDAEINEAFAKALSRHGYGFQYAVLQQARSLFQSGKSPWIPWVPEFPVVVQGFNTRIDIVFFQPQRQFYLVCECKRANPATSNWCFGRAPRPQESGFATHSYMEMLRNDGNRVHFELQLLVQSDRIYQVALEVNTGRKGDTGGSSRDEIEDAATQVCRGFNGLIQFFGGERAHNLLNINQTVGFVPAIVTTANIFATEAEITSPDIFTGKVGPFDPPLRSRDWIWYDYPQSPGLKHTISDSIHSSDLREVFYREYVRRVGIINPSGLEAFLGMMPWKH